MLERLCVGVLVVGLVEFSVEVVLVVSCGSELGWTFSLVKSLDECSFSWYLITYGILNKDVL